MDLAEHIGTILTVMGIMWTIIMSLVAIIFMGIKGDVKEIKDGFAKFIEEVFHRLSTQERSLDKLWAEHRILCKEHNNKERETP